MCHRRGQPAYVARLHRRGRRVDVDLAGGDRHPEARQEHRPQSARIVVRYAVCSGYDERGTHDRPAARLIAFSRIYREPHLIRELLNTHKHKWVTSLMKK